MEKIELVCDNCQSVFDFILEKKPNLNFAILKTAMRKKDIKVNQKRILQNIQLEKGDIVTLFLPDKKKKDVPVVFENEQILIVSKPAGMEVTKKDKAYAQSECIEDVFEGCFACHRLDKNTEGLLILAKSKKVQNLMAEAIKLRKVQKYYVAIVAGKVKKGDSFEDYLKKEENGHVKVFASEQKDAKIAKTNYVLKSAQQDLALLQIEILTGRTHQIRAQLAFHGIYVLGDQKYGDKQKNKIYHAKRQLLCAQKIHFGTLTGVLADLSDRCFETKPSFCLQNVLIEKQKFDKKLH